MWGGNLKSSQLYYDIFCLLWSERSVCYRPLLSDMPLCRLDIYVLLHSFMLTLSLLYQHCSFLDNSIIQALIVLSIHGLSAMGKACMDLQSNIIEESMDKMDKQLLQTKGIENRFWTEDASSFNIAATPDGGQDILMMWADILIFMDI